MTEQKSYRMAKILGNSIVERRKFFGMTQIELANRMDMAPDALSRIENGIVAPRFNRIEQFAAILDCSVADLFREDKHSLPAQSEKIAELLNSLPHDKRESLLNIFSSLVSMIRK